MARNTSGLWKGIADALDPTGAPAPRRTDDIDLTDERSRPDPPAPSGTELGERGGNMVVPLDTWTRILEQVGNVHEAGQQLAEARERAARAETENRFLREQIDDLKARGTGGRRASSKPAPRPTAAAQTAPASSAAATTSEAGPTPPTETPPTSPAPRSRNPLRRAAGSGRTSRARQRASDWLRPS